MDENKVYKVYSDPGHGWTAVKFSDLIKLGILQKISKFSYFKGSTAYLEDDSDMTLFCNKFKAMYGHFPALEFHNSDKTSPIRSYERYPYDCISD